MAITAYPLTGSNQAPLNSDRPPQYFFAATKSDANYLEDPAAAGTPVISQGIIVSTAAEAVRVEFAEKEPGQTRGRQYTFPAGSLLVGVYYRMNIIKVLSTGTGGTVVVNVGV